MKDYRREVAGAVAALDLEGVPPLLGEALAAGRKAPVLLASMCQGLTKVGKLFEKGEYFLADLVLAAEVMKEGLKVLAPHLLPERLGRKGTVVLCTVKGDIHDIGKNLVGTMLSSSGFRVVDLGVDVPSERVVEAVRKNPGCALGLSVLLTTMVGSVAEVVESLRRAGLREKMRIAIGGACTTAQVAKSVGADSVGRDAIQAVRIFESFMV